MVLPNRYNLASEGAIASFSYTDIADGTGVQRFFAFVSEDDSAKDRHLTTNSSILSVDIETNTGISDVNFILLSDFDFDLTTFNLPRTIKGVAIINFPLRCGGTGSSDKKSLAYVIVKIRKWDGSSETEIASKQSPTLDPEASDETKTITLSITIPQTDFEPGETLRMTIEVWAKRATGGGKNDVFVAIAHDPANRAGDSFPSNPTQMVMDLPFKIDR